MTKLSKKTLTRLLNPSYRKSILNGIKKADLENLYMADYARYVVDSQIMSRAKGYEEDKSAHYGFSPIGVICAVLADGTVDKKFFEFNTINHFLKLEQGEYAVEVVMCILVLWKQMDKRVKNFNPEVIDAELAKIESEMIEAQKKAAEEKAKEEKDNDASAQQDTQNTPTGGTFDANGVFQPTFAVHRA